MSKNTNDNQDLQIHIQTIDTGLCSRHNAPSLKLGVSPSPHSKLCSNIYPYMSSSSSPPPLGLLPSADGSAGGVSSVPEGGAAELTSGVDSADAEGGAESLLAVGAGTGAAGAAGAGVWKADMPAPMSLRRKFAASASFLSHAKYAWDHTRPIGAVRVVERHAFGFLAL